MKTPEEITDEVQAMLARLNLTPAQRQIAVAYEHEVFRALQEKAVELTRFGMNPEDVHQGLKSGLAIALLVVQRSEEE